MVQVPQSRELLSGGPRDDEPTDSFRVLPTSSRSHPVSTPPYSDLGQGPVVEQVDRLLRRAVALGASDVHVEPGEADVRVRYRVDGILRLAGTLRASQGQAIASRIKVLAGLDVAERRRPQDGRLQFEGGVDVRVSVVPTTAGEKVVLRLLDSDAQALDLDRLGFEADDLERFRAAVTAPHGIVLVTGPTGSGKTTTLYAALSEVARPEVNVATVEDPVEYALDGVNQTQARPDLGFGFAEALRAFLRQDPDIIMVGEIRDAETAGVAARAALTGHLVLSTLHTNDAAAAVPRLADMGVAPYLLAASVRLVAAQRLVRLLCEACKQPGDEPGTFEATGCEACGDTGYRGREAVYEVLPVSDELAAAIGRGAPHAEVLAHARSAGLRSLHENAERKWRAGRTSRSEVHRVV